MATWPVRTCVHRERVHVRIHTPLARKREESEELLFLGSPLILALSLCAAYLRPRLVRCTAAAAASTTYTHAHTYIYSLFLHGVCDALSRERERTGEAPGK